MEAAARLTRAAGAPAAGARQDVTLLLPATTRAATAAPLQAEFWAVALSTPLRLFGAICLHQRFLSHAAPILHQLGSAVSHEPRQQQRPLQRQGHPPPLLQRHFQQQHQLQQQRQTPQQQHLRVQQPHLPLQQQHLPLQQQHLPLQQQKQSAQQQQLSAYGVTVNQPPYPGRPPSFLAASRAPRLPPGRGLAEQQRIQLEKPPSPYYQLQQDIAAAMAGQHSAAANVVHAAANVVQIGRGGGAVQRGDAAAAHQTATAALEDRLRQWQQHRQWNLEHQGPAYRAGTGEADDNEPGLSSAAACVSPTSSGSVVRAPAVTLHQRQRQLQHQQQPMQHQKHREEQQKYRVVQQEHQQGRLQQQPLHQEQQHIISSQQRAHQQAHRVQPVASGVRAGGVSPTKKPLVARSAAVAAASSPPAGATNSSRPVSAAASDGAWGVLRFCEALALGALHVIDQDLPLSAIENGVLREQQQLRRQQQQQLRLLQQQQDFSAEQQQQILLHQQHLQQQREQQWSNAYALRAHVQQHPARPHALNAAQEQLEKRKRLMKVARANLLLAVYADLFLPGADAATASSSAAASPSSPVAPPSFGADPAAAAAAAVAVSAVSPSRVRASAAGAPAPAVPVAFSPAPPAACPITAPSPTAADLKANARGTPSKRDDQRAGGEDASLPCKVTATSAAAARENSADAKVAAAAARDEVAAPSRPLGEAPANGGATCPTGAIPCADPSEAAASRPPAGGADGESSAASAARTEASAVATTGARGAATPAAAPELGGISAAGGKTFPTTASRRRLLEESEKAERAAQQQMRYALVGPLPRARVLRLLEWLPASLRAASKGAADAALPAAAREWTETAAFAGDGQHKQQQNAMGIFQPTARIWFEFFVRLQQLHAHGVPLAQFPRFIAFMRSALPTFPHFFGITPQLRSAVAALPAAASPPSASALRKHCRSGVTVAGGEDRSPGSLSAAEHTSASSPPLPPSSSSSAPSSCSSSSPSRVSPAAAEAASPDLWWQLHAPQRRFLLQALGQMNLPYAFLALFQRELHALPLDGHGDVCSSRVSFSSSASSPFPLPSSWNFKDSFSWLATLIPTLRGSALVMYDQLRLPRGLQAAIALAAAPRAAGSAHTGVRGPAAAPATPSVAAPLAAKTGPAGSAGAQERAGATATPEPAAPATATTAARRSTPAEAAALPADTLRRGPATPFVAVDAAASGTGAARSEAEGSPRESSVMLRPPRTLDEPLAAEAYAHASRALLSCWHELWCRMQLSPNVPPQAKLQFFFHALPWAPVMQKTCDDVYAHMGRLRVHDLASLACSARIRQVQLLRLFHHLKSLQQQEEQQHQRQRLQQERTQQQRQGVEEVAAKRDEEDVERGGLSGKAVDPLKDYALLWTQHLAGAPPLLCTHPGLQGQWKHLLEGLIGAWNLFGDTLASLQSMHELLTDVDFPWAVMEEPESVWLRHAAQLRVYAEGDEATQAAAASMPPPSSTLLACENPLEAAAAACLPQHAAGRMQQQLDERRWDARTSRNRNSSAPAGASEGTQGESNSSSRTARNASSAVEHAGEIRSSQRSELTLFGHRSAALLNQQPDEWLALPRAVLALERLYCRAATALCEADPNEAAEVFQYRPQTFVALMLIASFPSPCASIQTYDACGMSASALPAALLPSPTSRNALFVLSRLPPSPPLFQKMQEHIFHIAPFPAEGSKGCIHLLSALILLCARWRRLSETRSRTLEDFAAVATTLHGQQQRPQRQHAWAAEESRFLNQVFRHIRTLTEVWYMAAVQNPGLRDQGVRQLLAIQQVLREIEDVSSGRFLVNKLKERPTPGKAGYAACLLAALTNCQTPSASSLKLDILELLGTWCFRTFLHGTPTWPALPVGSPFDPVPVSQYDPLGCCLPVSVQQRRIAAASALSPAAVVSGPPAVLSGLSTSPSAGVSPAAVSSPSAAASASAGSPILPVFANSPVPLLTYQQLVSVDTSPLLSQSEMSFTFVLSTSYFFQVLFDAALRPPGALPSSRLQQQAASRTASVSSAGVSSAGSSRGSSLSSSSSSSDTPITSSRATSPSGRGEVVHGGDRETVAAAEGVHAGHVAETGRKGKQSLSDSRGGKQWTGWLAADADVERALHLPLLLPKLLHMWKRRLLAPQQLPFKEFLWPVDASPAGPRDVVLPAHSAAASASPFDPPAHTARPPASPVSRLKEEEKRPIDFPVPALVLFLCRAARVPVEELVEEGFRGVGKAADSSASPQNVSRREQLETLPPGGRFVAECAGMPQMQPPTLRAETRTTNKADPQTAASEGRPRDEAGTATGALAAEDDAGASERTGEVFHDAAKESEKDDPFAESEGDSTMDILPGEDELLADLGLEDLEGNVSFEETPRPLQATAAEEAERGARTGKAATVAETASTKATGREPVKQSAATALPGMQSTIGAADEEAGQDKGAMPGFTPTVSAFAKPLKKLSLASIALAMTVIDEELQCVSRVCKTAYKQSSVENAATTAFFSPFASARAYRTALTYLYESFHLLFVTNLASASSFQLQELVKETRRLTVLPAYLPFPGDSAVSSEKTRSASPALPGRGSSAEYGERIDERSSCTAPPRQQILPDGSASAAAAGEAPLTVHPLEALRERAHRERSCYFHGAALQAVLLRLAARQQSSGGGREKGRRATPAAAAAPGGSNPACTGTSEQSFCDNSETPQADAQTNTQGDSRAQQEVVETWQLFELLLQMLSGAPAAVREKFFPFLLNEASLQERGGCGAATNPTTFLQQGFQALCDVLPLLSLSHLARVALVIARLDLLRYSAATQKDCSSLFPSSSVCPALFYSGAGSLAGTSPTTAAADDASLQHMHLLLNWAPAAARRRGARQQQGETENAKPEGRRPWTEERTAAASPQVSEQAVDEELAFLSSVREDDGGAQARRTAAATALQNVLEAALRVQLGTHGHELPFSDVTMLLWAVTVMPQPKPDILFPLFDRLESILSLLLREKRFLAGADNLPPQLPYPTASPIFRFLQGQLMTHCARLRAAWASLIMEGDPSLTASLQKTFPLTWTAFQLLQSETYLAERTMLTETYLFSGYRGKRSGGGTAAVLPLVQFLLLTLEKRGVQLEECAFNVTIPGLPFRYNLAVPSRRLLFIVGCHCAHSTATVAADDPLHSVGHIIADTVNYTPTAALAVLQQWPRRSSTSTETTDVLRDHPAHSFESSPGATKETRERIAAAQEDARADEATAEEQEERRAAAATQGEYRREGGGVGGGGEAALAAAAEWQLEDCVIGEVQSATHSAAADARSAGGRHFIKRLTKRAGYRLVEVDTSNAGAIEALLADVFER